VKSRVSSAVVSVLHKMRFGDGNKEGGQKRTARRKVNMEPGKSVTASDMNEPVPGSSTATGTRKPAKQQKTVENEAYEHSSSDEDSDMEPESTSETDSDSHESTKTETDADTETNNEDSVAKKDSSSAFYRMSKTKVQYPLTSICSVLLISIPGTGILKLYTSLQSQAELFLRQEHTFIYFNCESALIMLYVHRKSAVQCN